MYVSKQPSVVGRVSARPDARAIVKGNAAHPNLSGYVDFYRHKDGVVLLTELWGLPYDATPCANNIFAMHIHATGDCAGDMSFSSAGGHYNPGNCPHPAHAGDLPPLFSNHGYAWQGFFTDRFTVPEIIGRAIIIHGQRDDFTTQPAGDAGQRIGCGVIEKRG